MGTFWQDLRYGFRMLWKSPGFTAAAIITLAAGIGLNTAIFSVVNSILLRPLPYREPQRLVQVWETSQQIGDNRGVASPDDFFDWRKQARSFEGLSAFSLWLFSLTGTSEATEIPGMKVSPDFFALLGITPQLGRAFSTEDDRPDKSRVAVISHGCWQRRFGGDSEVVGKTIRLDGDSYTVIGVLPSDFRQSELVIDYNAEVWTPLVIQPAMNNRANHYLRVIGRLNHGATLEQAQSEMTAIARSLAQAYPATNADRGVNLVALHEQVTGNIRWSLIVLQFATGFVLLIACTNVANLLLARVAGREKEMAIRLALGAGRWQLVRLLLSESLLLALIGGALGLLLAVWGIDLLVSLAPRDIPRLDEISLDARVLSFTLLLSILTAGFFGLVPAWQSAKVNLNETLKAMSHGATRGRGLRGLLVVAEIALALMLLICAGLLLRSLVSLQKVDLGFNPERLLTMRVSLLSSKYQEQQQVSDFYQQVLARIQSLPGVQSAALINTPPFVRMRNTWVNFDLAGRMSEPGRAPTAQYRLISPDYFRTMEIAMVRGRTFTERDTQDAAQVAIINEDLARSYFPDADPIGQKVVIGKTEREIVGVSTGTRHRSLESESGSELYVPHTQSPRGTVVLVVRTASDPNMFVAACQKSIWEQDPDAAVSNVAPMTEVLSGVIARPRFNAMVLTVFSVVALILASVGIYGVMSYTVMQNTREIGIRMALGAQQSDILKLVVGQGLLLALIGIGLGLGGAFGLTRLIESLLFGVGATDLKTFAAVSLLFLAVALLSCLIPARRAMKVDPMEALRYE